MWARQYAYTDIYRYIHRKRVGRDEIRNTDGGKQKHRTNKHKIKQKAFHFGLTQTQPTKF